MPGPFYFAWAGGAIEPQITLVTNGTTHGARPTLATLVGDVVIQQLQNLASVQDLETGAFYRLAGPGIAAGTFFVFDDSILSGLPGAVNLSAPGTNSFNAQFTATKGVVLGVALGTLTQGSNLVSGLGTAFAPGSYGIFGTGIGETNVPVGTTDGTTVISGGGVTIIGSCYLVADGLGGGQLEILAATPHTHLGLDAFGQPTSITTYAVAAQPVRATASGQFPLTLSGFPTGDAYSVTGIPASALSGLMPGLIYNISGNGIQVGSTFVAPTGGTAVELDRIATSSELNAILTITGPRTPNAPWNAALHTRFDEEVLNVEIVHEEGGLATLTISLKNPGVGLLRTGRNLWCWLSWDSAWPAGPQNLVLLFNGRLIGSPQLQADEIVRLQFLARPDDLNAQKENLANSLGVLPYYDPVWFANPVTADTVLETYSALYHIDRTSLAVTVSDIIEGEDGTVAIGEDHSIYDKFALSYGQPPLVAVTISGTVGWSQQAEGRLDVTQAIVTAFHNSGSAYNQTFPIGTWYDGGGGLISCLCGDGLKSDWPKPGTNIGGGWSLSTLNDGSGRPFCYILDATRTNQGGWLQPTYFNVTMAGQSPPASQAGNTTDQSNVNTYLNPFGQFTAGFPLNVYKIRMNLNYRADRRRTETVSAVLTGAVQSMLSDPSENDRETVSLSSEYVGQGVDSDGAIPIGNVAYRSYFQTARGAISFEYLLLVARAKMRARARAIDIAFAVDWRTALAISLRQNVQLTDRRLPGSVATGKVKSLRLTAGTAGMLGEFQIGCTIGTGAAVTAPQAGLAVYVDTGYVNSGYQVMAGQQLPVAGLADFYYEPLDDFAVLDDGLDLTNLTIDQALNECIVRNGLSVQLPALHAFQGTVPPNLGDPVGTMRTLTTNVTLDLKPLQGAEFHTTFKPAVTQLSLPKTIDLTA